MNAVCQDIVSVLTENTENNIFRLVYDRRKFIGVSKSDVNELTICLNIHRINMNITSQMLFNGLVKTNQTFGLTYGLLLGCSKLEYLQYILALAHS